MQAGYVHRKEVHPQAPCRIKTCNLRFETCNPHPGYAKLLVFMEALLRRIKLSRWESVS